MRAARASTATRLFMHPAESGTDVARFEEPRFPVRFRTPRRVAPRSVRFRSTIAYLARGTRGALLSEKTARHSFRPPGRGMMPRGSIRTVFSFADQPGDDAPASGQLTLAGGPFVAARAPLCQACLERPVFSFPVFPLPPRR